MFSYSGCTKGLFEISSRSTNKNCIFPLFLILFYLHCSDLLVHRYVLCYTYTTPITPYHFPFVSALDTHCQLAHSLFPISFTCIALTYSFIGTCFVTLNTSPTPNTFLSPAPS